MKMKPSIGLLSVMLLCTTLTSHAAIISPIGKGKHKSTLTEAGKRERLEEIKKRTAEIKMADKSGLARAEKKAMKKELRSMNKESRAIRGGVYLSLGAIVVVVLLLALLL